MSIRASLIAVLGVMALACTVVFSVTAARRAHDRRDAQAATAAAHRLSPLRGATRSACHGDNTVFCVTVSQHVAAAARTMTQAMSAAASKPATMTCKWMSFGLAARQQSCLVAVRWGDHGAFAFVDPTFVRVAGKPRLSGALVSLSTG